MTVKRESDKWLSSTTCLRMFVEVYPGIYSLRGVKEIKSIVPPIKNNNEKLPNTKTLSLENLKDKRSLKSSLFKTTKRYL